MRNNKKRGFTLVELLVVIAILAILATVSVVGYTSYIKSTTIQADNHVAGQLNNFLEAYKVNHREPITVDNIRDVTDDILELGGMEELNPQSAEYGYNFYFNLETGKYELLHDDDAINGGSGVAALMKALFGSAHAADATYAIRPENSFTYGNKYFLVNSGDELGNLIDDIYNFNGSIEELKALYEETLADVVTPAGNDISAKMQLALREFVWLTNNGTFVISLSDTHTFPVSNIEATTERFDIVGLKTDINGNTETISKDDPLAVVSGNVTITIPGNVMIYGDSLNIKVEGDATVTIKIDAASWDEIEMDAGFTTSDVVLELGGKEYKLNSDKIIDASTGTALDKVLTYSNPMTGFDIMIQDLGDDLLHTVINTGLNVGYMGWNKGVLTLQVSSTEITALDSTKPVSSTEVIWEIVGEAADYLELVGNQLKLKDGVDALTFCEKIESFKVKAKSVVNEAGERIETGVDTITAELEIKVVKLASANLSLEGATNAWRDGSTIALTYDGENTKEYNVSVFSYTYNHDEARTNDYIKLNNDISLSTTCNDPYCCKHYVCQYTLDNHTHDANCCTHGSTYAGDIIVEKDVEISGALGSTGKITRYRCRMCSNTEEGHYCYSYVTDAIRPLGSAWEIGTIYDNKDCTNSCQNGVDPKDAVVTHSSHGAGCALTCNHVCGSANQACVYVYKEGHVHTTQTDCIECKGHTPQIIEGVKITTTGAANLALNATVDNLTINHVVNVTVIDFSKISFTVNPELKAIASTGIEIGNANAVKIGDLFKEKSDKQYWAAAENGVLKFYTGKDDNGELILVPTSGDFCVNANEITIGDALAGSFKFTGTANGVKMAVFSGDVQISEEITFNVVNGANVTSWDEFVAQLDSNSMKNDVVLLNNIQMSGDVNFFNIGSGKTLYGNNFTIDIKNGRDSNTGIIELSGTLRDAKIVGSVYPDVALSTNDEYGSACVSAWGNSVIENCYIANCRSPLRINSGTVSVKNSVLFGGRYANIDMTGGTLKVQGTVTTIQQVVKSSNNKDVIGVGVAGWFNDSQKKVELEVTVDPITGKEKTADLIQYNFVSKDLAENNKLPSIKMDLKIFKLTVIDTSEAFNAAFSDSQYASLIFNGSNGEKYMNATMFASDKYMVNYTPTNNDGTITIAIPGQSGATKVSLVIEYDKSKYTEVSVDDGTNNDGFMYITDADWTKGATYTFALANGKFDSFDFKLDQIKIDGADAFKTVIADNNLNYTALSYATNSSLLSDSFENLLVEATNYGFHGRGLHYGKINAEIHAVQNTEGSELSEFYRVKLEEYIEMTEGEGAGRDYYTPENFEFSSIGTIKNYWEVKDEISK